MNLKVWGKPAHSESSLPDGVRYGSATSWRIFTRPFRAAGPVVAFIAVVGVGFTEFGVTFEEVVIHEHDVAELYAVSLRFDTTKLCNNEKPTKPLQCFLSGGHRAVNSTGVDEVWYDVVRPKAHADGHVDTATGTRVRMAGDK